MNTVHQNLKRVPQFFLAIFVTLVSLISVSSHRLIPLWNDSTVIREDSRAVLPVRRPLSVSSCGSCVHGVCSGLNCSCEYGWSGVDCSVLSDCSNVGGCGEHGVCTFGGICRCDLLWSGPNCSIGSCPHNCSSHGQCETRRGECICDHRWGGRACQRRLCASNCSDAGQCIDGLCLCFDGFSDPKKSPEEEDCSSCKNQCSYNGECNKQTRQCICSPWFTGDDCSLEICPGGCSGHGSCLQGVCACDTGWTSYACDERTCPDSCSGHGTCIAGHCLCQSGYEGLSCDTLHLCSQDEETACSGHGTCESQAGNATCICDRGWAGPVCADSVSATLRRACPNNCSGHGSCLSNAHVGNNTCVCDVGWAGADCSLQAGSSLCDVHSTGLSCSGRGLCANGSCVCDRGFSGSECESVEDMVCNITSGVHALASCAKFTG
jgi:tenascin